MKLADKSDGEMRAVVWSSSDSLWQRWSGIILGAHLEFLGHIVTCVEMLWHNMMLFCSVEFAG